MNNDKDLDEVEKNIIKTISFFDLFDYPLTVWELWQYFPLKIGLLELEKKVIKFNDLENIDGFYFLKGRKSIVETRCRRYNYANEKIKIAKKVSALFRFLPSVKFVAVANLIGHHNLRDESDIDIFIISAPNRLWLSRFFCAGLMKITGMRPSKKDKRNKICLSFYASSDSLNMEGLQNKPSDPYFCQWLLGLHPIYDAENYLNLLFFKNSWLQNYFPNNPLVKNVLADDKVRRDFVEKVFCKLGDLLNLLSKKLQLHILPEKIRDLAFIQKGVIVNDNILRFYINDRRNDFYQKYLDKLKQLNIYD